MIHKERIGYAQVPTLGTPRNTRLIEHIKLVEERRHSNFASVDESIIKCIKPYGNGFYWNFFDPMFAHYITEFTNVLLTQNIIKGYLPVINGFRSASYANERFNMNNGDSLWTPHRAGLAVDILCDSNRDRILSEADAFGFSGLGRGSGFCHIDIAGTGSWGYSNIEPYRR